MEKMTHTPEPWAVSPLNESCFGVKHTPHSFSHIGLCEMRVNFEPENEANAARIVDCVNACEGMKDPAAEIAALRQRIAELESVSTPPQCVSTPPERVSTPPEQPASEARAFESFYVDCTKEQYPEVKAILEAQGYELSGSEWLDGEDCVTTDNHGIYMTFAMGDKICDEPIYTLAQLSEKYGVEQPTDFRDFVVPLEHATLTREEVAARCVAAAERKGYVADPIPMWGTLKGSDELGMEANHFFTGIIADGYAFHNHDCQDTRPNTLTTLEAFEEYCGVEPAEQPAPKTRLEWLNELPDGYRERAVANCRELIGDIRGTYECVDMAEAIMGMCDWTETPEDWRFWDAVYMHYRNGTPLPPLPSNQP